MHLALMLACVAGDPAPTSPPGGGNDSGAAHPFAAIAGDWAGEMVQDDLGSYYGEFTLLDHGEVGEPIGEHFKQTFDGSSWCEIQLLRAAGGDDGGLRTVGYRTASEPPDICGDGEVPTKLEDPDWWQNWELLEDGRLYFWITALDGSTPVVATLERVD